MRKINTESVSSCPEMSAPVPCRAEASDFQKIKIASGGEISPFPDRSMERSPKKHPARGSAFASTRTPVPVPCEAKAFDCPVTKKRQFLLRIATDEEINPPPDGGMGAKPPKLPARGRASANTRTPFPCRAKQRLSIAIPCPHKKPKSKKIKPAVSYIK